MQTTYLNDQPAFYSKDGVSGRKLYETHEADIIVLTIEPHKNLFSHSVPMNVAIYVLTGNPIITIADDKQECPVGTMITCPKDAMHAIDNPYDDPVQVMVIKLNPNNNK